MPTTENNVEPEKTKLPPPTHAEVLKGIPSEYLKPQPSRCLFLGFSLLVISFFAYQLTSTELGIWAKLLYSLPIGIAFGTMGFYSHETLHHAIFKNRLLMNVTSILSFAPYLCTPIYWHKFHTQLHHGNTQTPNKDPDAFPTLETFNKIKMSKFIYNFFPGSESIISYAYLFHGFNFHCLISQVYFLTKSPSLKTRWLFLCQLIAQLGILLCYAYVLTPANLIYGFVIPLAIGNFMLMSHIITNHYTRPLLKDEIPHLGLSQTVRVPSFMGFFFMNFAYHTEHHFLPSMPMTRKNVKFIQQKLQKAFPDEYCSEDIIPAIRKVYGTPRIYKTHDTLIDPFTGRESQIL